MADRTRAQRTLDYLLGRNALIGVAALMLLLLSGFATWKGMNDFILGVQSGNGAIQTLDAPAGLQIQTGVIIGLMVAALTFLMWLALRETFGIRRTLRSRILTGILYGFLAIWSVGFGYGFWWSLVAGPEATKAGLTGQAEDVRDAAVVVKARLEAVRARLDSVVAHSERQMAREASSGGSCGIASGAGQGPLFQARRGVRDSVAGLQSDITSNWLSAIDNSLDEINAQMVAATTAVAGENLAERQAAFEQAAADIRGKAGQISAQSNSLGAAYASQMRGLASEVSVPPREAGFSCYDPTLASLLTEAAAESEKPLSVDLRPAAFSEGAAGVANAVLGLWTNIGDYLGAMVGYLMGQDAPSEIEGQGVTGRDLIALLAAIGVDLGLFVLTVLNPPPAPRLSPDAEEEIKRAIGVTLERSSKDLEWLKKHLFHHKDAAYLVVPNYYSCLNEKVIASAEDHELALWAEAKAPDQEASADAKEEWRKKVRGRLTEEVDGDELQRGQALNLFAGVLVDIDLIKLLNETELQRALADEKRLSLSMAPIDDTNVDEVPKLRNHGILSKARHALKDAGWSRNARKDAEIYLMIDTEGLSPFLKAFNEAG